MKQRIIAFHKEFKKHTTVAILAAFAFLIALAWRDFFSDLVSYLIKNFGLSGEVYLYKLISAVLITLIAVIGIMIISKINIEEKQDEKEMKAKKK